MLDHFRNNFSVGRSGFVVNFLNFITDHGWLSLYLFLFGAIAVVGRDVYAVRRMLDSGANGPPDPARESRRSSPPFLSAAC